jgi:hypothetical protein
MTEHQPPKSTLVDLVDKSGSNAAGGAKANDNSALPFDSAASAPQRMTMLRAKPGNETVPKRMTMLRRPA